MEEKEKDYSSYIFYWHKTDELSVDDFLRLEKVALLENTMMKHRIFLAYRPDFMPPCVIGLN